jgi:signal transduction histidine kinase/CheY-like chemotaxis protein
VPVDKRQGRDLRCVGMQSISPELARSALDAAPDAMIIIDADGRVRYANRQVSILFGHPHADIVGQDVERLMPEQHRGRRHDGTEFPIEISLAPLEDGDLTLRAVAIRDVTDRKRVEAELVVAREAAERANLGKSRFLATASHDLRQPLQTLALLNGALRRTDTDPASAEALKQQEQAIGAMSRLMNALLDISKLESGAIKPEPADFSVSSLFEELRRDFAGVAAKKSLALQVEASQHWVHSDPSLVEQILRNLISNAVKYTLQGCVWLRCQYENTAIRLEVGDTGIGIAADHLPLIYDEFYQVGVQANSTREGYGLGLSIVQRLVNLLHLELQVHSVVGQGSVFALLLPATQSRPQIVHKMTETQTSNSEQAARSRILLVEDDMAVRDATRLLLKIEGYQVVAVASLAEALQRARESDGIDLLLTDYHLAQGETGIQVIAAIRDTLKTPVKSVLMTGDTSSAIKDLPRDPNFRVASKPIRAEELLTLLRGLLAT